MPFLPVEPRRRATILAVAVAVVCAALIAVAMLGPWSASSAPTAEQTAAAPGTPTSGSTPSAGTSAPTGPAEAVDAPAATTVAAATGSSVPVSSAPGGAATSTLANPQASGAPLVFRVMRERGDWVEVQLAERPNGTTGWIPTSAVSLTTDPYAIVVTVATNTLDLYEDGEVVHSYPVATGTGGTPTPVGRFALTELLAPTNSGYGPYAYGTTAFSEVLNSFGGGPGQIGLHGTDDSASVGTAASHGCVRMHDADITALAEMLPLGTPFQVR